jgi:hypothetical protein
MLQTYIKNLKATNFLCLFFSKFSSLGDWTLFGLTAVNKQAVADSNKLKATIIVCDEVTVIKKPQVLLHPGLIFVIYNICV